MDREGLEGGNTVAASDSPPEPLTRKGAIWLAPGTQRYMRGAHRPVRADRWQLPEILGLVLGLMAMAAGALLAASPALTAAGLTPAGYRVADLVLPAKSPGVYSGGAVVIISSPSDGTTLSAADGLIGPSAFSGFCSTTATSEQCSFVLGKTTYQAVDRLTGRRGARAWTRTYSNGVKVQIPLLSSDAPVPLPLGLH